MLADEVVRTLKHGWVKLEALHLPMAVMGGVALSACVERTNRFGYRATAPLQVRVGLDAHKE
jgi:hypothetical protein